MGVVRSLLGEMQRYRVESCKEFVGEMQGIDRVESCKEFVRRNARYSIELGVVRRMLGEMQGI